MFLIAMNLIGMSRSHGFIWMTAYQTYSRGRLRITSPNPETDPDVRFQMLSDERDLVRMRDGIRRLREFARHPAIRNAADAVGFGNPILMVQGMVEAPPDGDALDDWMRAHCFDSQHAAGTCRMGPASNPRSVVDPELSRSRNRRTASNRLLRDARDSPRQHSSQHGDDRRADGRPPANTI